MTRAACSSVHGLLQIQAYERLAPLQGQCVAVLEAGGKSSEDELVLAVSGGIRLHKEYGSSTNAVYLEDVSPEARWAALDGLRQINDAGMLHGCAHTGSLLVQPSQVQYRHSNSAVLPAHCTSLCCQSCACRL